MEAYYAFQNCIRDNEALSRAMECIAATDAERCRMIESIRAKTAKAASVTATVLLYTLLYKCFSRKPDSLCFCWTGKPGIINAPYFFNLTHSADGVAVVVSDTPVGIDTEWRNEKNHKRLGKRFFSAADNRRLESGADFFDIWCENEAYLKFTGKGLMLPMSQLRKEKGIVIANGCPPGALVLPEIPVPGYGLCVCVTPNTAIKQLVFPDSISGFTM